MRQQTVINKSPFIHRQKGQRSKILLPKRDAALVTLKIFRGILITRNRRKKQRDNYVLYVVSTASVMLTLLSIAQFSSVWASPNSPNHK